MNNLIHTKENRRYSMIIEGFTAYIEYDIRDGNYVLTHTYVPPGLRGMGAGKKVLEATLADIREKGAKVIPQCPFIVTHLQRNHQYDDMIAS